MRARQAAFEVGGQVEREFGLRAIALENLFDRRDVGERGIEHFRANATVQRFSSSSASQASNGCGSAAGRSCVCTAPVHESGHHRRQRGKTQHLFPFYRPCRHLDFLATRTEARREKIEI